MRLGARALLIIAWLAAGAGLMWLALRQLDGQRLVDALRGASAWPLAVALGVDALCILCKAGKWHAILRPLGRAGLLRLQASYYAAGATATLLPFRLDELVRAYTAARLTRLPGAPLLGSMALERLIDFGALLVTMVALTLALPLPEWLATAPRIVGATALVIAVVVVGLQLAAPRIRWPGLLGRLTRGLARGGDALRRPRLMVAAVALSAGEWIANIAVIVLVMIAMGIDLPWHAALLLTVLSMASYALPLVPAGIGVYEVAVRLALPELYPVSAEQAVALALVIHATLLLPMATVGVGVLAFAGIRLRDVRRWERETDPST